MRTLGVDLSSDPKKTAACSISWTEDLARIENLHLWVEDESLAALMLGSDWIGIDAPFGWPMQFIEAVRTWSEAGQWPDLEPQNLRFRTTDLIVREKARLPLSVSSDRIAMTAMRCARVLTDYAEKRFGEGGRVNRSGDDHVVEVYPAAALVLWSDEASDLRFDPQGYKGDSDSAREKRQTLLESLERTVPWLPLEPQDRVACIDSDDALDSLLCSLVARAAALKKTSRPKTMEETAQAAIEGWIHLPEQDSLELLAQAS